MNKILVGNNGIYLDDKKCRNNTIKIDNDGEYSLEYIDNGNYHIKFIINGNVKIVESSFDRELVINNEYMIEKGMLKVIKFYDNLSVNENNDIELCNEGSKVDYYIANICRGVEDYIININHKHKKTESNIVNKSVALKNSHVHFIVNSKVPRNADKSILNQNTRIVTMGDCDAKISPNMYIDLEDVIAKHGSIIGTFKDEDVFYLMSKGISYNDALKLLIKGYLLSKLEIDVDLRMRILSIIDTYWR